MDTDHGGSPGTLHDGSAPTPRGAGPDTPPPVHRLDRRLTEKIIRFGVHRFGQEWLRRAEEDFDDPDRATPLLTAWALYHVQVEGEPVATWFLVEDEPPPAESERAWVEAQQASWLSVWQVEAVEPDHLIRFRDLLTGEEREVHESSGSYAVSCGDAVLARIVDYQGLSVICGSHPDILPEPMAARVLDQLRLRVRRKRTVPVERLREERTGRYLIGCWEEAAEKLVQTRTSPRC